MKRRTFAFGALFVALLAKVRGASAASVAPSAPSILVGRKRYVDLDGRWLEVASDAPSWRDVPEAQKPTPYALKRGRGENEDRWLDIREADYLKLDRRRKAGL